MARFGRNLALWFIIVLLLMVLFNIFNGSQGTGYSVPEWATEWGPYGIGVFAYLLLVGSIQRRRQATLRSREAAIAATAHADAAQIIALLQEIKAAQLLARTDQQAS